MRIEILSNGSGSISSLQNGLSNLHTDIGATIDSLRGAQRKLNNITGGVGNLSGAVSSLQARINNEELKLASVQNFAQKTSTFISNTISTDAQVASLVAQNQEKFFDRYTWLRPNVKEKSWWEKFVDGWNDFWGDVGEALKSAFEGIVEFVKEHAVELIIGAVAIVVGAAIIALTGGAAAAFIPALLAGLKAAAISALVGGAISGVIALLTGGDFLSAFGDGLAQGFMLGGIFFAISSSISAIRSIIVSTKSGNKIGQSIVRETKFFSEGTEQAIKYPGGVEYTNGFPRFEKWAKASAKFVKPTLNAGKNHTGLSGNYYWDSKLANAQCGFKTTPKGYVWHHVEDMQTLILVPQDLHSTAFGGMFHKGGASLIKEFLGL